MNGKTLARYGSTHKGLQITHSEYSSIKSNGTGGCSDGQFMPYAELIREKALRSRKDCNRETLFFLLDISITPIQQLLGVEEINFQ